MSQEEYEKYKLKKDMLDYYKNKISATNSKKEEVKKLKKIYYLDIM